MWKKIVGCFLIWRCLLLMVPFAAEKFLPYRPDFAFTNIGYYTKSTFLRSQPALNAWANFDGVEYLAIAGRGYIDEARFFPLLPVMIKGLAAPLAARPFDLTYFAIGFLLANGFFLASVFVFYRLLRLDFNDRIAQETLLALFLFPTSFFFVSIYTESLFLLLALLSFYFARRQNWLAAAVCGALLSVTRIIGIFILPALIWELWQHNRRNFRQFFTLKNFLLLLLIPSGLIGWLIFNFQKWGNAWFFLTAQGDLHNGRSTNVIINPLQTLFRYGKILMTLPLQQYEWWIALLELTSFCLALVLFYSAWRQKIRSSYLIFAGLCFLLPVLSGTLTGLPRYVAILFPLFLPIGLIRQKNWRYMWFALSCVLMLLLTAAFSRGYFVA